jgi:hypothetical protein
MAKLDRLIFWPSLWLMVKRAPILAIDWYRV